MYRTGSLFLVFAMASGCTHIQLRNNMANQARTLSDIYQQQVLDNLALFTYDPGSLPFFAYASQGTSTVTDKGTLNLTNSWTRAPAAHFLFNQTAADPSLERDAQEAWQLAPVNDPRKLELMRCAYQQVIAAHISAAPSLDCPSCTRIFRNFYTGDPELPIAAAEKRGIVTSNCLNTHPWLAMGCKECAPKERGFCIGRYCNVRVWVLPGRRDELAKLTLAILDFATHDPPEKKFKTVVFNLDQSGNLTTANKSFVSISGNVAVDETNDALLTLPFITSLERICTRNEYGLTLNDLTRIAPERIANPEPPKELDRFHIKQREWDEIRRNLAKLKSFRVDSWSPDFITTLDSAGLGTDTRYGPPPSSEQKSGSLQFQLPLNLVPPNTSRNP